MEATCCQNPDMPRRRDDRDPVLLGDGFGKCRQQIYNYIRRLDYEVIQNDSRIKRTINSELSRASQVPYRSKLLCFVYFRVIISAIALCYSA